MARLLILATTLLTLHFGGASALAHEAQGGLQQLRGQVNSASNGITNDIVHLHDHLPSGS